MSKNKPIVFGSGDDEYKVINSKTLPNGDFEVTAAPNNLYNRYLNSSWGAQVSSLFKSQQSLKDYLIQRLNERYNVVDTEEDGDTVYAVVEADGKKYAVSLFVGEINE